MSPVETAAAAASASIFVNGEHTRVPRGSTIATLLAQLEMTGRRVAVARNRSVVPRSSYGEVAIGEGDRIEILEAVGGG